MDLEYETKRLKLKILKGNGQNARQVLDFYLANLNIFERYEPARPDNFYTESYQKAVLTCEYNLAVKLNTVRFWVYAKEHPDVLIGTICFHDIFYSVYEHCEAGYKFDQRYWNMGYAREALEMGILIMFNDLNLHRIKAYVKEDNWPSIHLLESLNFQYEGTCRQSIKIQGEWEDHLQYALIR